jgi:AcrR family transcriptional regulator
MSREYLRSQKHGKVIRKEGRPRDPEVDRRILTAALGQLVESGYSRMSIESIAAEAGASKPAIYRRWSSKADLATAALSELRFAEPLPAAGPPIERLKNILRNFRRSLLRPHGMALIGVVLAEEGHTPELLGLFRKRIVEPRRHMIASVLVEAMRSGHVRKNADVEAAVNLLVGSFYARYLTGEPIASGWIDRIVTVVWDGIARGK